jgi:hypothetical protein
MFSDVLVNMFIVSLSCFFYYALDLVLPAEKMGLDLSSNML